MENRMELVAVAVCAIVVAIVVGITLTVFLVSS